MICKQIVEHLLNHHFGIELSEIHYTASQMDSAFAVNDCFKEFLDGDNNAENMAIQVIKTFDELNKNLRSLDELPLVITSILGQSPVFRYTELQPVIANARLFSKGDKETFNASIINEGVIQFGLLFLPFARLVSKKNVLFDEISLLFKVYNISI